jgi:hypothetical protein
METNSFFIELLQHSLSPIALISGVGLILLSVSNRLGRTIDRSRAIILELEKEDHYLLEEIKAKKIEQLQILHKRNKFLRNSISGISLSILCSSLLIPILIIDQVFHPNIQVVGIVAFSCSILGIIFSAIFLFLDVRITLKALEKEADQFIRIK